jgi:hypothetical protein
MKTVLVLFSFFSISAWAETCPILTGNYTSGDMKVGFVQKDCNSLTRLTGTSLKREDLNFRVKREFEINGRPFQLNELQTETLTYADGIYTFKFNFDCPRYTLKHGHCTGRSFTVQQLENRWLKVVFKDVRCEDGFKGDITKQFVLIYESGPR